MSLFFFFFWSPSSPSGKKKKKKIYEFLQTTKETTKAQTQTNIKNQETQRPREKHQLWPVVVHFIHTNCGS